MKKREKTGIMSNIPLLPIAKEILEKHNYRLFVPSNQKVNAYLKEIGILCGIKKKLHFHVARHKQSPYQLLINKLHSLRLEIGNDLETSLLLRYA